MNRHERTYGILHMKLANNQIFEFSKLGNKPTIDHESTTYHGLWLRN